MSIKHVAKHSDWGDNSKMVLGIAKSLIRRSVGALGYKLVAIPNSRPSALRRLKRIWAADHPLIRIAKEHLDGSTPPANLPPLGERWGAYASRLRSRIRRISSPEDLIFFSQSPEAGVETHFRPHELIGYCHSFDLQLLADLPADLYDAFASFRSPHIIRPDSVVEYKGRMIDFVSLCAARTMLSILNLLKGQWPRTICDVGGGTGTYARCWLTNSAHRPDLVAIVDAPETLVYSETLLRNELGDSQVQHISAPTTIPNRSGVVLCPIANIQALENISFDLVTNTFSMQEMTDAWVDWYMDWLDRQSCRFFYSENYFANALGNMIEGHNSWSPRPSPRWELIDSQFHLGNRNAAYMLFRKDSTEVIHKAGGPPKGAEAWLAHLDLARCHKDELSLRRALDFARSELPFVPKEAWQVAKMLAELTGADGDRQAFLELDDVRRAGNEAVHQ